LFFAAERSSQLFGLVTNGINQALGPLISESHAKGDIPRLDVLVRGAVVLSSVFAVIGMLVVLFLGAPLLSLFDASYSNSVGVAVFVVLSFGQAIAALCGTSNIVLQMTGEHRALLRILASVGVFGTALLAILAVSLGPLGAAVGAALTTAAWNILAARHVKRAIGIDPTILSMMPQWRIQRNP